MVLTAGVSHLDELDRIDGEELLMRDLEASAGALMSSSSLSSSASAAQTGHGNASGQGLANTGVNPKSSRNSGTRSSVNKTAQKRAQVRLFQTPTQIKPYLSPNPNLHINPILTLSTNQPSLQSLLFFSTY